jgi:hypothetical protein
MSPPVTTIDVVVGVGVAAVVAGVVVGIVACVVAGIAVGAVVGSDGVEEGAIVTCKERVGKEQRKNAAQSCCAPERRCTAPERR